MKIKYPISLKQILLFSFLIILVLGVSTALVSTLIRADDRIKAEENNFALNGRTAQTIQSAFENIQSNSYVLFEAFSAAKNEAAKKELGNAFFRSNPDVLFVKSEDTGLLLNPSCVVSENKIGELIKETDTIYANTSKTFDFPSILFSYKYGPSNAVKTGTVGLNVASLCELMGTGSNNTTILVDENAKILINPDFGSTRTERSEIRSLVKDLAKNSEESNTQTVIDGVFTAVHQIKDNLFVITTISEKSVYAVINRTTYRISSLWLCFLSPSS